MDGEVGEGTEGGMYVCMCACVCVPYCMHVCGGIGIALCLRVPLRSKER